MKVWELLCPVYSRDACQGAKRHFLHPAGFATPCLCWLNVTRQELPRNWRTPARHSVGAFPDTYLEVPPHPCFPISSKCLLTSTYLSCSQHHRTASASAEEMPGLRVLTPQLTGWEAQQVTATPPWNCTQAFGKPMQSERLTPTVSDTRNCILLTNSVSSLLSKGSVY